MEWKRLGRDQKKRLDREVLNRAAEERDLEREIGTGVGEGKVDRKI